MKIINNERHYPSKKNIAKDNFIDSFQNNIEYFGSGREALLTLLKTLNIKQGDTVLLPEYCPEGLVAPLVSLNITIIFYKLNADLRFDIHDIETKSKEAKALVAINYFGIDYNTSELFKYCTANRIVLIRDFAHYIPSEIKINNIQTDFLLCSFPKIFAVPDGSCLISKNKIKYVKIEEGINVKKAIYVILQRIILRLNFLCYNNLIGQVCLSFYSLFIYLFRPYNLLLSYFNTPTKITDFSLKILRSISISEEINKRQELINVYLRNLTNDIVFYNYQNSLCMSLGFGFPIILVTNSVRENLYTNLKLYGVEANIFMSRWNYFDYSCDSKSFGKSFMERHLILPTASHLNTDDVLYVCNLINNFFGHQKIVK